MAKISALILSKNEERNIEDCIKSVLFCDEVLVVDDFSTDRTKEMAERLGARVLQRRMDGDWGGQRTFAIQNAAHEWILFVDADERVPEALAEEIRTVVAKGEKRACRRPQAGERRRVHVRSEHLCYRTQPARYGLRGFRHRLFGL